MHAVQRIVSADYFDALGVRIAAGRSFAKADTRAAPRVTVVNRTFAEKYLAATPIGDTLPGFFDNPCCNIDPLSPGVEVIGVINDIVHDNVTDAAQPEIYVSSQQIDPSRLRTSQPTVVIRTSDNPQVWIPILRSIVREQDSSIAVDSVMTMEDRVLTSLARPRLYAALLGAFAVLALSIAAVGVFGVLSYNIAQRSREIAFRTAIGARRHDVLRLILSQTVAVVAVGMLAGLWISFGTVRYLSTFLYGITSYDPLTFVAVPIVLILVSGLACVMPAWRALRIDPMQLIRGQ